MAQSPRRRRGIRSWGCGVVFPGSFCNHSRDAVHCAISWHRAWLRLHAIGYRYSGDFFLNRPRNESALLLVKRAARLAQVPAETGSMDVTGETADGFSADRNVAIFVVCDRRATWRRGPHLGVRISTRAQPGVLVERRVHDANCLCADPRLRARGHAAARDRERLLFHWGKIP